ncbi:hypothetical protein SEEN567_16150 [Salmonella enterica subsp. enterica serovar Newport str. CVM 19567]|nr:hypothetical protein SEEN567_16150 [Salmonella enterica subsp. enterica serovar Newport str. CVM 19567]
MVVNLFFKFLIKFSFFIILSGFMKNLGVKNIFTSRLSF